MPEEIAPGEHEIVVVIDEPMSKTGTNGDPRAPLDAANPLDAGSI
jgi:hypothetical protein